MAQSRPVEKALAVSQPRQKHGRRALDAHVSEFPLTTETATQTNLTEGSFILSAADLGVMPLEARSAERFAAAGPFSPS